MKILFVNYQDNYGTGGYRVAYRLYQTLQQRGLSCAYLVRKKMSYDSTVIPVPLNGIKNRLQYKILSVALRGLFKRQLSSIQTSWSPNLISENKRRLFARLDPDIVHLHWICGDFISIGNFADIRKPIVWTMHDMWAFTGGCHYASGCDRYKSSCGSCPQVKSDRAYDLSRILYDKKRRVYAHVRDMTIIAPSRWMAERLRESSLLNGRNIRVIPNGIDHHIFKNQGKSISRQILNIPKDKCIVLFGAVGATSNRRKGFRYLHPALKAVTGRVKDIEVMIMGGDRAAVTEDFGCRAHHLGMLYDELTLSLAYSAADVTVVPSTDENLSTVIMESLSCGTPVVAFNIGGNPDLVEHLQNGYLAAPFEVEDLARGIEWIIADRDRLAKFSDRSRKKIEEEFSLNCVAEKHKSLYRDIMNGNKVYS